jgi:Xaa-Pro aminopeptidase
VDGSPVIRSLMAVLTPFEVGLLRRACEAGVWMHEQVRDVLRPGLTEKKFAAILKQKFSERFPSDEYEYREAGLWDVRNPAAGDSSCFHAVLTDRVFKPGDQLFRGFSGVSFAGYHADIDRMWHLGMPPREILDTYKLTWECNQAMAAAIRPGGKCSDVYAAHANVERRYGVTPRPAGRCGHGYRNSGGLSVHPDNHTILEPGMVLSVEPMFVSAFGFFDLEDQYLVTDTGAEVLHKPAPEVLPTVDC